MTAKPWNWMTAGLAAACLAALAGCHTCGQCHQGCPTGGCPDRWRGKCHDGRCQGDCCHDGQSIDGAVIGCLNTRSNAIPDRYPVGSVVRSHFHAMETNGEAADFIIHRNEFVGETSELTPNAKDHLLEIGARMRSAPFPVIVERSEDNANPELDAERRHAVASVLNTLGNPDADQRTFVSPSYGEGLRSLESEIDYYRFIYSRGGFGGTNNNNQNNVGGFNGFGAGGFAR